jgi:hypothetical protein
VGKAMSEAFGDKSRGISKLGEFFESAQKIDPQEFAARFGEAFLLHHGSIGRLKIPTTTTATVTLEGAATSGGIPFNPKADFVVFALRKKLEAEGEDELVWVGRSEENDVVIPDESISAVHAFFRRDAEGRFYIQDVGSRNGSYVNGESIPPQGLGEAVLLKSGARVRMGSVKMTFLPAAEFRSLVLRLLS